MERYLCLQIRCEEKSTNCLKVAYKHSFYSNRIGPGGYSKLSNCTYLRENSEQSSDIFPFGTKKQLQFLRQKDSL